MNLSRNEPVVIDGSILEGGGQILRSSTALSAILGIPIKIHNIRGGRSKPGLRPQHLTGLKLTRDLTNGTLTGDAIGSTEITFSPGILTGGDFSVDTKTAASITLIIQAVLPCLLFAKRKSSVKIRGGTNVGMAPQIDYTTEVFQAVAKHFGVQFSCQTMTRGFYPKGGGEVCLTVEPVKSLHAAILDQPQLLMKVRGVSFIAGKLPIRVANEMRDSATQYLHSALKEIPVDIKSFQDNNATGNGAAIILVAETNDGLVLGGSGLGEPKLPASRVGQQAAKELVESSSRKVCLDQFSQDQVIILMALAEGISRVLVGPLTLHTQTAIHVTSLLTGAKFNVIDRNTQPETFIIECNGIGFVNNDVC